MALYRDIFEIFSNLELSIIFWSVLFWLALPLTALRIEKGRKILLDILSMTADFIKLFFKPRTLPVWISHIIYVIFLIILLSHLNIWSARWWKEVIIWFWGSYYLIFEIVTTSGKQESMLRDIACNSLNVILVVEFLIGLYTVPLFMALVIVPIATILSVFNSVAGLDKEYKMVERLTGLLLALLGFGLTILAVTHLVAHPWTLLDPNVYPSLYLPVLLTILFIPYLYSVGIYCAYDHIITHLRNEDHFYFTIWHIIKRFHIDLAALNEFTDKKLQALKGSDTQEGIEDVLNGPNQKFPNNREERIYWELVEAQDKAEVEANIKYPLTIKEITEGFSFENQRKLVIDETTVSPGSHVEITGRKSNPDTTIPDFTAQAFDEDDNLIAVGQLRAEWLHQQGLDLLKRNTEQNTDLYQKLEKTYEEEVLKEYDINRERANEILAKGLSENYPTPDPITIEEWIK